VKRAKSIAETVNNQKDREFNKKRKEKKAHKKRVARQKALDKQSRKFQKDMEKKAKMRAE
jgi:hypothetical protein